MQHLFDIEIAKKYDVNIAIFLNNMAFWIQKNMANNKHFYEGTYWTYNSIDAYKVLFPYWTNKQIRSIIDKCIKEKLIRKGNFNKNSYDRTCWYGLTDEGAKLLNLTILPNGQMDLQKKANGFPQKGEPIPDIKPDNKKQIRESKIKEPSKSSKKSTNSKIPPLETFSLSSFNDPDYIFNFIKDSQILKRCSRSGIDPANVLEKFINDVKNKGLKEFSEPLLNVWALRELDYIKRKRTRQ